MHPLFNSRIKRKTAFVVLFVWLFALVSGVANACWIQTTEMRVHESLTVYPSSAKDANVDAAANEGAISKHDSGLSTSKSQCLKVCDDGSQPSPKQKVGFDLTDPILVPLHAVAWKSVPPAISAFDQAVSQRCLSPEQPIRVRLSRLAL